MRNGSRLPERARRSEAVKRRLAHASVALACALAFAGCSNNGVCAAGQTSVDSTVHEFLVAAQRGDLAGVEAQLAPAFEVSDSDVEQLRQSVQGVDVNALFITSSSETPTQYQVLVADQDGTLVGKYSVGEMIDQQPGCFVVVWGHRRAPGPSEYVTPSAASTQKP
jgi:hypothetical protein